jgi:hypothetical protein
MRLSPGVNQIFAGLDAALNFHMTAGTGCVLDHYYGISSVRDRGACHDLNGFPGAYGTAEASSSFYLSDNAQFWRQKFKISSTHRVTIASGARKRRKLAVSCDRLGKYTSQGARERDTFRIAHMHIAAVAADGFLGLLKREHASRGRRRSHHCRL